MHQTYEAINQLQRGALHFMGYFSLCLE